MGIMASCHRFVVLGGAVLSLAACDAKPQEVKGGSPPAAAPSAIAANPVAPSTPAGAKPAVATISPAAEKEAGDIFTARCSLCHGAKGEGNGPASAGLNPPPRNFTDPAWQEKVTDDHIEKIIQLGGPAVGKSPLMPPNPDLTSRPEIVAALRAHVRSLRKL